MSLAPFRILIVDNEYLIGMDADRIITDALPFVSVDICTRERCLQQLEQGRFDGLLLDIGHSPATIRDIIDTAIQTSGLAVAFSTISHKFEDGVAEFPDIPVVQKPYEEAELIDAVRRMIG